MKKIFLFGAGLCCILAQAHASDIPKPLSVGVKAGLNVSNVLHDNKLGTEGLMGVHGGLVTHYQITKKHGVITELLYSQKGFETADGSRKNTLNYLEIPALYKHRFIKRTRGGNLREKHRKGHFFASLGPQFSMLMGSESERLKTVNNADANLTKTDLYAYTRAFDFCAVAGVGYSLKMGLTLEARFAQGLREINGPSNALLPQGARNSTVQVGVSYLLPMAVY